MLEMTSEARRDSPMPCDPTLMKNPYTVTLCTTKEGLKSVMGRYPEHDGPTFPFVNAGSDATTHVFQKLKLIVVCIEARDHQFGQVVGLLAHEGMHVWQEFMNRIGECHPSSEFGAYALQSIVQDLFVEYCEQMGIPHNKKPNWFKLSEVKV